ncbi:hypothetical protein Arnit_0186 [Arcobacter nitrofigilis DSM 7299]|jgi:hypothetical protein|uniref:Uncharacterized protein n=1 Tax=Arcobacter nitrofigilis (strain ATCC 33309 / DSM 7299 / CCUG 15893 / LMG 7604 / NCTC 12251 / CI) TaxID=572480 RepID=D5V4C0_ARCNC|nr:hypothetical protein [Arcobacter nitrofigilis]ADG91853.1 hypothetical protein Arnit_0186 [Arcobacter nitrofigilis DSM 7299]|tara:strand:- start:2551 stop:2766 length:216 start_codon:yes stop_codon:yes gene_type:complete
MIKYIIVIGLININLFALKIEAVNADIKDNSKNFYIENKRKIYKPLKIKTIKPMKSVFLKPNKNIILYPLK